ncbi:MAG: transposase [Bacteroidota bacterium]|nr:transposase [Bacteroidota bacterium]
MKITITHPGQKQYSEALKRQVVREYERGGYSKKDLSRKYQIQGHDRILQWCRKYGRLYYPKNKFIGRSLKDPQKRRIKELEHELREAREKLMVYEKLIEITSRDIGGDVRKNIATKLSENWPPKQDK